MCETAPTVLKGRRNADEALLHRGPALGFSLERLEHHPANENDPRRYERPVSPEPEARAGVGGNGPRLGPEDRAFRAGRVGAQRPRDLDESGRVEAGEL